MPEIDGAVLLARDAGGYAAICRLVTERHLGANWRDLLGRRSARREPRPPGQEPRPPKPSGEMHFDLADAIRRHATGVFVLTSSESLLESLADALPKSALFAELQNFGDAESRARVHCLARLAARFT